MTIGEAIAIGIIIGMITTFILIGILLNGVDLYFEIIETTVERIDEHKRWLAKRAAYEVSSDLKDIEEWMNKESVKEVIGSKEFGVWLRHRVSAEIDRKFGTADIQRDIEDDIYPAISFKPFENRDEKSLIEYMNSHPEISNFMVYLRCKYKHQTEWEYLIEACSPHCHDEILWLNDWHEGQQDVEYLAITQIKQ